MSKLPKESANANILMGQGFLDCNSAATPAVDTLDAARLAGMAVLLADDRATNREILRDSLSRWKMTTKVVGGAATALEELHRAVASGAPLPLVLTDAHIPEIDGFGRVERIRQKLCLTISGLSC
jgi:PleD family two-component response regulator